MDTSKKYIFIMVVLLVSLRSYGQITEWERTGLRFGMYSTSILGDVGTKTDGSYDISQFNYFDKGITFNFSVEKYFKPDIRFFGTINYFSFKVTEERRGYSYNTSLYGLDLGVHYNLFSKTYKLYNNQRFDRKTGLTRKNLGFQFYAIGGVGLSTGSVSPNLPLSLRGGSTSPTFVSLPLGLGFRCTLTDNVLFCTEFITRYCFADDLDAFDRNATKGNKSDDILVSGGFSFVYLLKKPRPRF